MPGLFQTDKELCAWGKNTNLTPQQLPNTTEKNQVGFGWTLMASLDLGN